MHHWGAISALGCFAASVQQPLVKINCIMHVPGYISPNLGCFYQEVNTWSFNKFMTPNLCSDHHMNGLRTQHHCIAMSDHSFNLNSISNLYPNLKRMGHMHKPKTIKQF